MYAGDSLPSSLSPSVVDEDERVALGLVSEDGLARTDGDRENRVEIPVGLVVTDRQLVFVALGGDGTDAGRLDYGDLAGVDTEGETLVLRTTDGVAWRFRPAEPDSDAVDAAVRHLCWIGEVRSRLVGIRDDLELATRRIRTLAADLAWEEALETYRDARTRLDDVVCLVQCTTPLRDSVLAPELTDLDRKLESACARLYVERCRSQLDLTGQLLGYRDYEQARRVFEETREYHDRASSHAEEVKRADAFQFGRQRELVSDLEELRWEIESTATEPLQEAKEATVEADTAETRPAEIEHLEAALEWYRGIRTLGWYEYLGEDADAIGAALERTARRLVDSHEQAARSHWNEGARQETGGDREAAIRACTVATEHLERACELAGEFDLHRADQLESRLGRMFEMLLDVQRAGEDAGEVPDAVRAEQGPALDDVPEPELPRLEDLADVDLHHDVTLDLVGDGDPLVLDDTHESGSATGDRSDAGKRRQSNEP